VPFPLKGFEMLRRGSRSRKGETVGDLAQGRGVAGPGNVIMEVIKNLFLTTGKGTH
jgi:hypothetical protein